MTDETTALAALLHETEVCWNNEFGCDGPEDHADVAARLIAAGVRVTPSPDAPGPDRAALIRELRTAARGIDHSLADEPDYERFDAAIVALEHAAAARALEVVRLARPKCDLVCGHTRDHWVAEENDDAER